MESPTDEHGFVTVDDQLRTTASGVYFCTLETSSPALSWRTADFSTASKLPIHRRSLAQICRRPQHPTHRVDCDPEVVTVGLTEAQARQQHGDVRATVYDLAGNSKSQILGAAGGVKVVQAGAHNGPVVGIHMVGKRVAELSGEAQLIVNWGVHTQTRWPSSSTLTRHRTKPSGKLISLLPAGRCTCTTRCRFRVRQRCVSGWLEPLRRRRRRHQRAAGPIPGASQCGRPGSNL